MYLYDTLRRELVELRPRTAGEVSMYVCGPTVYDVPHLGHARTAVTYDVLRRYLTWRGLAVTLVSNITDIDDKIIDRAAAAGSSEAEIAARYTETYIAEIGALGVADPSERPMATGFVAEMVAFVAELLARDAAYVIDGAGVYFDVSRFGDYGRLPGRAPDELRESAGARVAIDERKRDPLDFALWKAAKPGEPTWPSPWMAGRPGWHIECVAMSLGLLGDGFDIHGGGSDLIFPHHENERAEATAAGHRFARLWVHSAMVNVAGEKMAKSAGNFRTLADALAAHDPRALRLAMLQAHYRSTMEIDEAVLAAAAAGLARLDAFARRVTAHAVPAGNDSVSTDSTVAPAAVGPAGADSDSTDGAAGVSTADDDDVGAAARAAFADSTGSPADAADGSTAGDDVGSTARAVFAEAMDADMGTPAAVAVIFDLARTGNTCLDRGETERAAGLLAVAQELGAALGMEFGGNGQAGAHGGDGGVGGDGNADSAAIQQQVDERQAARAAHDFATADRIRAELAEVGIELTDTPAGTTWRRAR